MRRFEGSKKERRQAVVLGVGFLCATLLSIWMLVDSRLHPTAPGNSTGVATMCICVFGLMLALSFILFGLASTVVEANDVGIVQRRFNRIRRMSWSEIVALDEGRATADAALKISDSAGKTISIEFSMLEGKAPELRSLILDRLAGLKQAEVARLSKESHCISLAPKLATAAILLIASALFIGTTVGYRALQEPDAWILFFILDLFWVLLFGLGIWAAPRRLHWSEDEIRLTGFKTDRRFPWSRVESVYLYQTSTKSGLSELLTIRSGKQKIVLGSSMERYALIREVVLAHVPSESVTNGAQDRQIYSRQQETIGNRVLGVCIAILIGFGIYFLVAEVSRMRRIQFLASHGVIAKATVVGKDCGCGSGNITDVVYRFEVHGFPYTGENDIGSNSYPVHIGEAVSVYYLPENPHVSRLKALMNPRDRLGSLMFLEALIAAYPILIVVMIRRNRSKKAEEQSAAV